MSDRINLSRNAKRQIDATVKAAIEAAMGSVKVAQTATVAKPKAASPKAESMLTLKLKAVARPGKTVSTDKYEVIDGAGSFGVLYLPKGTKLGSVRLS